MPLHAKIEPAKIALQYHPKLRGLWPPEPSGPFARGSTFPLDGSDVLERVFYYAPVRHAQANISLKTVHQGQHQTRNLFIDDPDFAQQLASFLRDKVGQRIADLGAMEVDF